MEGTAIPGDALILSAAEAEALGDRLFELRCAAEDIQTALAENADAADLATMAAELVRMADAAERLR